jgi:hypothetical protein
MPAATRDVAWPAVSRSSTVTLMPRWRARHAIAMPMMPPPTITTSGCSFKGMQMMLARCRRGANVHPPRPWSEMDACPQMVQDHEALLKATTAFNDNPRAGNPPRDLTGPPRRLHHPWMTRQALEVV